jgi:hypothetical protein
MDGTYFDFRLKVVCGTQSDWVIDVNGILKDEVFSSFNMEGVSPEQGKNEILFYLSTADLAHSTSSRESEIKLKLIKKDNAPHLKIDLITQCITNEIPLDFVMVKDWSKYEAPKIGHPTVSQI